MKRMNKDDIIGAIIASLIVIGFVFELIKIFMDLNKKR